MNYYNPCQIGNPETPLLNQAFAGLIENWIYADRKYSQSATRRIFQTFDLCGFLQHGTIRETVDTAAKLSGLGAAIK